jgi:hypothetical protein
VDCTGCPHGKMKTNCTVCSGCEHGKNKYKCASLQSRSRGSAGSAAEA